MPPPAESTEEEVANLALANFLQTVEPTEATRALAHLVDGVALPIIHRVLARKSGVGGDQRMEIEEATSQAKAQLLDRLFVLRSEPGTPIRNLAAYVATLAYSAWAQHLSRVYPGRAILGNQLRHLLEDRRQRHSFACWYGPTESVGAAGPSGRGAMLRVAWKTNRPPSASTG